MFDALMLMAHNQSYVKVMLINAIIQARLQCSTCHFSRHIQDHTRWCFCEIFHAFLLDCWTAEENTHVLKGVVNSADSVQACQSACVNNASCDGVDWNPGAQTGQKCWLSGPWSRGKRPATGITHYNLDRNCAGI